jgi:hypothetical protein
MKKMVILGAASLLGLAACGTRVPTNEQLTRLLHEDAAAVNDPQARLDALAVNCLRTWSGDAKLTQDLPPSALAAPAKGKCRSRIDGWIADAARNPDRLEFDDVSAPGAVQRAMALLETRDGGAQATASSPQRTVPRPRSRRPWRRRTAPARRPTKSSLRVRAAGACRAMRSSARTS